MVGPNTVASTTLERHTQQICSMLSSAQPRRVVHGISSDLKDDTLTDQYYQQTITSLGFLDGSSIESVNVLFNSIQLDPHCELNIALLVIIMAVNSRRRHSSTDTIFHGSYLNERRKDISSCLPSTLTNWMLATKESCDLGI